MAVPSFPPRREADLLNWSRIFDDKINADPAAVGLAAGQAAAYSVLHSAFAAAFAAVRNPNTNSRQAVAAKNQAMDALLNGTGGAWQLVNIIQAFPGTDDSMRGQLGLRPPDKELTPVPAPDTGPRLSILSTSGRMVKLRLRDQTSPDRRGKPIGVQGATVLYCVSDTPQVDRAMWFFAMNTSRPVFDVEIPNCIEAGSRVWLTAFWFNARKDASPFATPQSTRIGDGLALAA